MAGIQSAAVMLCLSQQQERQREPRTAHLWPERTLKGEGVRKTDGVLLGIAGISLCCFGPFELSPL